MKKLILISAIMLGFSGFGQCKISTTYDKFEKAYKYESNIINVTKGATGFQMFVTKALKENKSAYSLFIISTSDGCLTSESSIQFLTDKGEVILLKYVGEIKCGASNFYFDVDENTLARIKESKITDIKIVYHEFYSNVELTEKNQEKIKSLLNCIINSKPENP